MELLSALPATYIIIAINVAATFIALGNEKLFRALLFNVDAVLNKGEVHRLITAGFLHADGNHLLFNMLTLFFFGPVLERDEMLGLNGFLIVYFASLILGNIWALIENMRRPEYNAVGASGAVSGVVVSFCLFAPFALLLIFFIIPMPAILFAVLYIAYSAFAMGRDNSNIGHEAHLGGALTGLVVTMLLVPGILDSLVEQLRSLI